jgi:hypothetical protein
MLDLIVVLAYVAGLIWVAARAFLRPDGIYLKSLIGFLGTIAIAASAWFCAGPFISGAAGPGALVIFLIVVTAAGIVAIVACASATLRHVMDALA